MPNFLRKDLSKDERLANPQAKATSPIATVIPPPVSILQHANRILNTDTTNIFITSHASGRLHTPEECR